MNTKIKENYTYALDIGTRTVIGVLSEKTGSGISIIDTELIEHPDRAMYDGQVHDIKEVSDIIKKVTSILEDRNQVKLKGAYIAAAGRSLKTEKVTITRDLDQTEELTQEFIDMIEIEAIQAAQDKLKNQIPIIKTLYYCVGNSVTGIKLDGINIKNPVGHSATKIEYSVIATFLPHNVSDTLYKAVEGAGLEIEGLTLEPIAAIEVSIPSKIRLLNLAIVDIGAGTSDIALTKDGDIYSYAMVDLAGDEVTEALMKTYLMGFDEAEKLKINLMKEEEQEFIDVVGVTHRERTEDIINAISEALNKIAARIANEIISVNKKSPDAVFLVGGSSQVPSLRERISNYLKLDDDKVMVKASGTLTRVDYKKKVLNSPEYITPMGIAFISHHTRKLDFISVRINSKVYRLFNRKNLTLSDALVIAGFSAKRLIQTRGKSLEFKLNGEEVKVVGTAGEPSKILLNAKLSSIDAPIKNLDIVEITKPIPGKNGSATLGEIIDFKAYTLKEGRRIKVVSAVYVNGIKMDESYSIRPGDDIITVRGENEPPNFEEYYNETPYDYSEHSKKEEPLDDKSSLGITLNGRNLKIKKEKEDYTLADILEHIRYKVDPNDNKLKLIKNKQNAKLEDEVKNGDSIEISFL